MQTNNLNTYTPSLDKDKLTILHHLMHQRAGGCAINQLGDNFHRLLDRSLPNLLGEMSQLGFIEWEGNHVYLTDLGLECYEYMPVYR
ncbi:hypothetical protein [Vibrio sp.]|uniref:hypothetical protein n=1 Tax=Vibrio sp. TaxID=678 RepID=UPI003D124AC5